MWEWFQSVYSPPHRVYPDEQTAPVPDFDNEEAGRDRIIELEFANVTPGRKRIVITRIDDSHRWRKDSRRLEPV